MMDLQAAIGMHQIKRVEKYWQRRLEIWDKYNSTFAGLPMGLPAPYEANARHALHLYTFLIDEKRAPATGDGFITALHRRNIGAGVHYRSIPGSPRLSASLWVEAGRLSECWSHWASDCITATFS